MLNSAIKSTDLPETDTESFASPSNTVSLSKTSSRMQIEKLGKNIRLKEEEYKRFLKDLKNGTMYSTNGPIHTLTTP